MCLLLFHDSSQKVQLKFEYEMYSPFLTTHKKIKHMLLIDLILVGTVQFLECAHNFHIVQRTE